MASLRYWPVRSSHTRLHQAVLIKVPQSIKSKASFSHFMSSVESGHPQNIPVKAPVNPSLLRPESSFRRLLKLSASWPSSTPLVDSSSPAARFTGPAWLMRALRLEIDPSSIDPSTASGEEPGSANWTSCQLEKQTGQKEPHLRVLKACIDHISTFRRICLAYLKDHFLQACHDSRCVCC